MPYLTITTHLEQPRRLHVAGEVDFASADELRTALAPLCDEQADLVVDFSEVTFLDSSGISALVTASVAIAPGSLVVHGAGPAARQALEVVGLGNLCD